MKQTKTNSLYRLVAFLLITILLIGVVGIVADGAQDPSSDDTPPLVTPSEPEKDKAEDKTDKPTSQPPILQVPEFTHYLTGLPIREVESQKIPLCYVVDSRSALYGISSSVFTVEIGMENGTSRYLFYTMQHESIGKIGAIAPTRSNVSTLLSYFGGILVHNGVDGWATYDTPSGESSLDLDRNGRYAYTESGTLVFTNSDLMAGAVEDTRLPTRFSDTPRLPFSFADYGSEIKAPGIATKITIPYGMQNETVLTYSSLDGRYLLSKNENAITDPINQAAVSYDNALILFSDAVTYEKADGTECLLDTKSGGTGYYFTRGTYLKVLWNVDADGNMKITDSAGKDLTINRGTTYLSFFKVSEKGKITIEK